MILRLLKCLNKFTIFCYLSAVCCGQEVAIPNDIIIYPKDDKETAHSRLIKVINGARKSIDMAAYNLKDPIIADALIERKKQGVSVRILREVNHFQHEFNKATQDPVIAKLLGAKIEIHDAPETFKAKHPNGHMHARYLIIDGQTIVLSTGNFDQTTFDHCRDFAFIFNNNAENGSVLSHIQAIFDSDWNNQPIVTAKTGLSIILGPEDQRNKIIQFLTSAKKSIKIYAQYLNDEQMANTLIELRSKGIEIQILMMACPTGYKEDPNEKIQDKLQAAKIDVKVVNVKDDKTYMHARAIIVDDHALVGTTSLSPPSLDDNREINLVIAGMVVSELGQQFARDWSKAVDLVKGRQIALDEKIDWNNIFFK